MNTYKTTDYCAECNESPDSASHMFDHEYVPPARFAVHEHGHTTRGARMVARVLAPVEKGAPYIEIGQLAMVEVPPNVVITDLDAQRATETRGIVLELVARHRKNQSAATTVRRQCKDLLDRLVALWSDET